MSLHQELQVDFCCPMNLHGLQGHSWFTMVCFSTWSISSLFFSGLRLTYSHSTLLWTQLQLHNNFFFINMLFKKCFHHLWLAQPWPVVCPFQSLLSSFSQKSPCNLPTSKTWSCKPKIQPMFKMVLHKMYAIRLIILSLSTRISTIEL